MKARGEAIDPLFSPAEAAALGNARETIFLGLVDEAPRFGFGLDPAAIEPLKARNDLKITDLRTIAVQGLVDAAHLPPLAEAKALIGWHARHRFCPNCGAPTRVVQAGWRRDCPSCKAEHFPRTDPVVIMLAIAGERCVLGRSPRFAPTMWSAWPALPSPARPSRKRCGAKCSKKPASRCGRVKYFAMSQPWPFPMLDDDRLPRAGAVGNHRHRPQRDRGRALVFDATNWRKCSAAAIPTA